MNNTTFRTFFDYCAMKRIFLIVLIMNIPGKHASAQYFERTYPGLNMSYVGTIDNTIDSGFIVCGTRDGGFLIKLKEDGDTEWTSRDSGNVQQSAAVIQNAGGDFIVIGSCNSLQYNSEAVVATYDNAGDPLTHFRIPPTDGWGTWGTTITRSPDRTLEHYCYYVDGYTSDNSFYLDNQDQIAGDMSTVGLNSITMDNTGNYYAACNLAFDMDSFFNWRNNVLLLSSNHFPRSEYFFDTDITSAAITSDGGVLLAGLYDSLGTKYLRLLKLDSNANLLWENYIADTDLYSVNQISQTNDGGFAILCAGDNGNNMYILFMKMDASGNTSWKHNFFGNGSSVPKNFVQLDDGYAILGSSLGDPHLIRTDSLGRTSATGFANELLSDLTVSVYPNPTNGLITLTVEGYTDELFFNVYDLTGRNVFSSAMKSSEGKYDLSLLSRGVYLYKIMLNGDTLKCGKLAVD